MTKSQLVSSSKQLFILGVRNANELYEWMNGVCTYIPGNCPCEMLRCFVICTYLKLLNSNSSINGAEEYLIKSMFVEFLQFKVGATYECERRVSFFRCAFIFTLLFL